MTTITVYVRPTVESYELIAPIDHISLVCHGVTYEPVEEVEVNDLHKFTFQVRTEPSKAPALPVFVVDSIGVSERLG